jgi:putative transposase
MEVSAATISAMTDKSLPLVEAWQNRPLEAVYPVVFLDAIHVHVRREGRVDRVAV